MQTDPLTFAAIELADLAALAGRHEDHEIATLIHRFRDLAARALVHGSRIATGASSSLVLVADSSDACVRAVLALVEAADAETNFPMLRAGLHRGAAWDVGGELFGSAILMSEAARSRATPGQVLCTADVARDLPPDSPAELAANGELAIANRFVGLYRTRDRRRPVSWSAVDPVCQMRVDRENPPAHLRTDVDHYFCSASCLETFQRSGAARRGSLEWG